MVEYALSIFTLRRASILDAMKAQQHYIPRLQDILRQRREAHCKALWEEVERLTQMAMVLGIQRVILLGSLVWGNPGLTSDVDLLLVWDTPLGFLERTAEVYRRLLPQVAADLFVYTPDELARMAHTPFVRRALAEGRVLYAA
jgi:predicted nucleotidyltransferase